MQSQQRNQADVIVRRARPDDYAAFACLFPELLVDDPIPNLDTWVSTLAPATWIAARHGEVLGYFYAQEYAETAYIRNIVVAPSARNGGVGRALMLAAAAYFRSQGKTSWRLNVKADNGPALALYQRMGMRTKYVATALRLPWAAASNVLNVLNAPPVGTAVVRDLAPDRDSTLETLFDLPRGQLASARDLGRLLFEAIAGPGGQPIGLAVFDPKFPGAFPFRMKNVDAVTPLLAAMRRHVPTDEHVNLVAEDDARLADLLQRAGASLRHKILHLEGSL